MIFQYYLIKLFLVCTNLRYFPHILNSVLFCFKKCPIVILAHFSLSLFSEVLVYDKYCVVTLSQINGLQIFSLVLQFCLFSLIIVSPLLWENVLWCNSSENLSFCFHCSGYLSKKHHCSGQICADLLMFLSGNVIVSQRMFVSLIYIGLVFTFDMR